MQMLTRRCGWLLLILAAGCVNLTVHVYFPAAEIRSALEEIESDVRGTETPPASSLLETPCSARFLSVRITFGPEKAYGQRSIDLEVETPTIISLKKQRKERYKKIEPFLDKGILGEGRTGYLVIRDQSKLRLKERGALKRLVVEENADRKNMYLAILSANGLSKDVLGRVEKLAAEAIRKVLKVGQWYEVEKDKWVQKKKKKEGKMESTGK